jgi:hypothetical protein
VASPRCIGGRIQLRGVSRQQFDRQAAAPCGDEPRDQPDAMQRQSVPYYRQLALQMTQQMVEKIDDLSSADGAEGEPESWLRQDQTDSSTAFFAGGKLFTAQDAVIESALATWTTTYYGDKWYVAVPLYWLLLLRVSR